MDFSRVFIFVTVVVIIATIIISGPLVASVDLTSNKGDGAIFVTGISDKANVEVVDEPVEPAILEHVETNRSGYRLMAPPLMVHVSGVRGSPRISYHVRIFELNYISLTTYFINSSWEGERRVLRLKEIILDESKVTQPVYQGDLTVSVHETNGTTVVYQTNITVQVRR